MIKIGIIESLILFLAKGGDMATEDFLKYRCLQSQVGGIYDNSQDEFQIKTISTEEAIERVIGYGIRCGRFYVQISRNLEENMLASAIAPCAKEGNIKSLMALYDNLRRAYKYGRKQGGGKFLIKEQVDCLNEANVFFMGLMQGKPMSKEALYRAWERTGEIFAKRLSLDVQIGATSHPVNEFFHEWKDVEKPYLEIHLK